jgi:hypothetical protein
LELQTNLGKLKTHGVKLGEKVVLLGLPEGIHAVSAMLPHILINDEFIQ